MSRRFEVLERRDVLAVAWLDFGALDPVSGVGAGFRAELLDLAVAAGISPFGDSEIVQIQNNIKDYVQRVYEDFNVEVHIGAEPTFVHEQVIFYHPGEDPIGFGQVAEVGYLDNLNDNLNGAVDVYTRNLSQFVDEYSGIVNRNQQIRDLSQTLGLTTAHELGHNFGLSHDMSFGDRKLDLGHDAEHEGFFQQNRHVMSTNSGTGRHLFNDLFWENPNVLSDLSQVVLSYGKDLLLGGPSVVNEQSIVHDAPWSAQFLTLTDHAQFGLPGVRSAYVTNGELATPNDVDFYSFFSVGNEMLTIKPHSFFTRYVDEVATRTQVYGPNNELLYNITPGRPWGSIDRIRVNLPLPTAGEYKVAVIPEPYVPLGPPLESTGNYDLILVLTQQRFPGDDNVLGVDDIDAVALAVRQGNQDPQFDMDLDGDVEQTDVDYLVTEMLDVVYGDVDLNGIFDYTDVILMFATGHFEDGVHGNSGWAQGDFNSDGDFDLADILLAFQLSEYWG